MLLAKGTQAFEDLASGNLERQFDLVRDLFSALSSLEIPNQGIDVQVICWLHAQATLGLISNPGSFRVGFVELYGSPHKPPPDNKLRDLMPDFVHELKRRWHTDDLLVLAAYCLWRLTWIHPFEDGNGRTARALTYLVLCLKLGAWLPGRITVIEKMMKHDTAYNAALRRADISFAEGLLDLEPLAVLIGEHVSEQLEST